MKLCRFGPSGEERPGIIAADGSLRDLSALITDLDADAWRPDTLSRLAEQDPLALPRVEGAVRFGSPIRRPGHFIAIGLNYADHAAESGMPVPVEPVVFSKAPSCICGPDDAVVIPKGSTKLDWEVELAFVIGTRAWQVREADALSHVAGYMICNDVSERAWQIEGTGQWIKGKSAPTFGPLGPWIVTSDEVPDPQALDLYLDLNGTRVQTGSTRTMIFPVATLVHFLSHKMVLEPGDVITTGTPPGVGMGKKPPVYLKAGDVMQLGISGLGTQRQTVVAEA